MTKTALVTGSSQGIGYEVCRRLISQPGIDNLICLARDSVRFHESCDELEILAQSHSTRVRRLAVDVGQRDQLLDAVKELRAGQENIDYLVNNAGYTNPVSLQQIDFDDFERTMAVNLYAPFTLVQELLRLGNRFEVILNVASTAGIQGRPGWLTYSASKAALINMSQVMREGRVPLSGGISHHQCEGQ